MGNIKENPIIKKLINVEKKLYYHTLNAKLEKHLIWSNNKSMRTLGRKSPVQLLAEKMAA